MALNDPLGDMIARIHNAQCAARRSVDASSRLRMNVLDVLKSEGFIRGYAAVEHSNGHAELEIELKYFDGEPVIREISRISKPGRGSMPRSRPWRVSITVWASLSCPRPRRDGGSRCPRRQCRRRNPLHGLYGKTVIEMMQTE